MSDFHFAVARVTAAQICRAVGLERSVPSVLDELTDILIRYMMMLGTAARDACEARGDSDSNAEDAMLAAVECAAARGGLLSTELSRRDGTSTVAGIEDILELLNWTHGSTNRRMIAVARPQRHSYFSIGAAQGAALAALPSSAAAASQFNAGSMPPPPETTLPAGTSADQGPPKPVPEQHTTEEQPDWLTLALQRQALMGHHDWFVNTQLGKPSDPDPTVYGQ